LAPDFVALNPVYATLAKTVFRKRVTLYQLRQLSTADESGWLGGEMDMIDPAGVMGGGVRP
jgi:hypothetical protein